MAREGEGNAYEKQGKNAEDTPFFYPKPTQKQDVTQGQFLNGI